MTLVRFLWECFWYYRKAKTVDNGVAYAAVSVHGVPQLTMLIAHGRTRGGLSQFATDYFAQL